MNGRSVLAVTAVALLALVGCEPGPAAPTVDEIGSRAEARGAQRGKKPKKDDGATEPEPTPVYVWYQVTQYDDSDPLWRFGLDGDRALLETDPTVTSWGTDYWGAWAEPFTLVDGAVTYTSGLVETTYTFTRLRGGAAYDVSKTLVQYPYLGGETTTTTSHVGIFEPAG